MLTLRKFTKRYGGEPVLNVDEHSFGSGIHWIRGENGSGKSTLLKCVAGLLAYEGEIEIQSVNQRRRPLEYRRVVNFAEAEPNFPSFLTPKDLIHFVGKCKGAKQSQRENYVRLFGVDHYFDKPCETLSSGMRKKVSLVMAFLGAPQVIALDEPFITLDDQASETLARVMVELVANETIILVASHEEVNAPGLSLASRITVKNKTLVL